MKQTMQQIMIANLMLLCCCAVFSAPVSAGGAADQHLTAQTRQCPPDILAPQGDAPARWQRPDRESRDAVVSLSAAEIERLLSQLRANFNVRSGKPVKASKPLFYLTVALAMFPQTASVAVLPAGDCQITVGNRVFPAVPYYFLQPVRAGPGSWLV